MIREEEVRLDTLEDELIAPEPSVRTPFPRDYLRGETDFSEPISPILQRN